MKEEEQDGDDAVANDGEHEQAEDGITGETVDEKTEE